MSRVYFAARWDKGTADYINCPMDRAEYDRFYDALLAAGPEAKTGRARKGSGRSSGILRVVCLLRCWLAAGATRCALGP